MKTLHLILCALVTVTVIDAQERGPQPRGVEIITPLTTNLFRSSPLNPSGRPITDGQAIVVGPSTDRFTSTAAAGRSTNLHLRAPLTNTVGSRVRELNTAGGRMSGLIGPVFPARDVNLTPTGRPIGAGRGVGVGRPGLGTTGLVGTAEAPLLTNAVLPGFEAGVVDQLPEATTPGPSVPLPAGTSPLAPPTPVAPPAPAVPGSVPPGGIPGNTPNSVPSVPGSAVPAPPTASPLAPPRGPTLAPTTPAPPAPAPGRAAGGAGAGTR